MADKYSHRERIEMILAGEKPDRHAASCWRHFFELENNAQGTAEAMVGFQRTFDWDFMKINPRADYHIQDWGLELEYSRDPYTKHVKKAFPVHSVEDWGKIKPLPLSAPSLGEHLRVVSLIRKAVGKELPVLMTIFTPLALAGRMVPDRQLLVKHLRETPDAVIPALEAITDTFTRFATELRNAGADGIFYATTQWASADMLTWNEYEKFSLPYDLPVVHAAGDDALNLLHVCSTNCYLKQLTDLDYRCRLLNWESDHPTNMPIDQAAESISHYTMVGGIDHTGWLLHSDPEEVANQIKRLCAKLDPARVILGPGCAVDPQVSNQHYRAVRESLS